ncbi:unnamed protein product [Periconia digitata]|uniref:Secreted protein n=1 Tax=Periconia digitata TaxID=1303443 RepID=A0A9W4UKX4_9PLEO|nr:unnamed protein product [Periconia digitata]
MGPLLLFLFFPCIHGHNSRLFQSRFIAAVRGEVAVASEVWVAAVVNIRDSGIYSENFRSAKKEGCWSKVIYHLEGLISKDWHDS